MSDDRKVPEPQPRMRLEVYTVTPGGEVRDRRPGVSIPEVMDADVTANPLRFPPCPCGSTGH
ncbi:hypothetical protein [Streptomyces vinaceus]|uniref:hypothetical protein n=1 Tax=Streptomyces vinaceus TaxID=1960 RepID=UPI0036CB2010